MVSKIDSAFAIGRDLFGADLALKAKVVSLCPRPRELIVLRWHRVAGTGISTSRDWGYGCMYRYINIHAGIAGRFCHFSLLAAACL